MATIILDGKKKKVKGTAEDDLIVGHAKGETIKGQGGDDEIHGGHGADILEGGEGDDTLVGGDDADTLEGGEGSDTYVITSWTESSAGREDEIIGFQSEDFIEIKQPEITSFDQIEIQQTGPTDYLVIGHTVQGDSRWDIRIRVNGTQPQEEQFIFSS